MVDAEALRTALDGHHEWLLTRETGQTFPFESHEIDLGSSGDRHFCFLDDEGYHKWRLKGFDRDDADIIVDLLSACGNKRETMRLIPRTAAAQLNAEVETARLLKANEIAALVLENRPGARLVRVALNAENGRIAQIDLALADRTPVTAIADVTSSVTVEMLVSMAILRLEKLGLRKNKPVVDAWVICEKRQAKNAQKLHALLSDRWKSKLTIVELNRKWDPVRLDELPRRSITELWRQKASKLVIPTQATTSETAEKIIKLAPDHIDVVTARQGETLRFSGLPFARVRLTAGQEKAWFGVGRGSRVLNMENWDELCELVHQLITHRAPAAVNKRHEYYRLASEAWLESLLRRNIDHLDANLILSPLYNQFRSSNDKIDMLALRRDGRLVIIELKTHPDREMTFQAADYWRKLELQRRRGILGAANLFDGREILDKPPLIYLVAPAWSFHRDYEFFARCISPEIEMWRFELHENWRESVKVLARQNYSETVFC